MSTDQLPTRSSVGDIWQLGRNFLYCGDSEQESIIDKQISSHGPAQIVFTDPPYKMTGGLPLNGCFSKKLYVRITDDGLRAFDPTRFLYLLPAYFKPKTISAFIFTSKELLPDYMGWCRDHRDSKTSGLKDMSSTILVWEKPHPMPIGSAHHPDVEYLLFFRKNTLWNHVDKAPLASRRRIIRANAIHGEHPTMKPIEIMSNQIRLTTDVDGLVYDPYVGSGSTILACEETGRRCIATELFPKWCDVAISRWEGATGKEAFRIYHDPT